MLIEVENLVKRYDKLVAVNHLNLHVQKGEIIGLLGPNGSGKTTTINCILSLLSYDKGSIKIFDTPMKPNRFDIKQKIGVVPQEVAVFNELTVQQNIDYFCGLYIKNKQQRKEYVQNAIQLVGLEKFTKFLPKKLSGGLLRRLNIACGIAHKPELIFLDEPTVAVDPQSRNLILDNIKKLNEEGATIVYTSHYMEEVEQLCKNIVIIDQGQVIAKGTKEELINLIAANEQIVVEVPSIDMEVLAEIKQLKGIEKVRYEMPYLTISSKHSSQDILNVLHFLEERQVPFGNFYSKQPTLNDVFLEITGKALRDE